MIRLPSNNSQKIRLPWNADKHWLALRATIGTAFMKLPDGQLCYQANLVQKHDSTGSSP